MLSVTTGVYFLVHCGVLQTHGLDTAQDILNAQRCPVQVKAEETAGRETCFNEECEGESRLHTEAAGHVFGPDLVKQGRDIEVMVRG